ncbi:ROK family transcriptional regulator [Sphingomonas sp. Leaf412]|uniref:ROK family protein n=1 Tax=Sphingomonas sp. Leaf412 TaxID=1736370 RepID=UPI0006FCDC64|nr:ROK family protein [Sphingomonas sp. Leaf412]KQT32009.1 ROK family transcriptional regulator [Sphingomonas sp. Leaf412]
MTGNTAGDFPTRFLRGDGWRTATANEGVVMDLLSRLGAASRADLARLTGLAPHSITRLVEPLLARDLLTEGAPVIAGRGKPSARLALNGAAAFSIGVSVMTDAVSLVVLDLAGTVAAGRSARLADTAIAPACAQIGRMIDAAIAETGHDRAALVGIGFGITGYFIGDGARLNPPRLLDPWALVPLDTMLADAFGTKVWVENDGNVAAVGETMLGHGRTVPDLAYLYFSAGFGGGVIAGGRLLRGRHGNAGEFASILPGGWPHPNLEALRLAFADAGISYPDLHAMLDRFDPDHPAVGSWLDAVMPSVDLIASAISATLDPGMIVLGGRLPASLADRMIARIALTNPERRGFHRPSPRIAASAIDGDAAAIGAATLPLRAAFFDPDNRNRTGDDRHAE